MKNPLISLIIPMYNAENYIEECLDSVVDQTYKNIEVLIIDDNSTDGSGKLANIYANQYHNITYKKTKNANAAKTRRDGLADAKGELVCFLDSDDIVDRRYVQTLYDAMKETNTEMSMCGIDVFSGEFHKPNEVRKYPSFYKIDSNANSFANHFHITDENKLTLQSWNAKLFKKSLFSSIDYTVLKTNIWEDVCTMVQILREVEKIGIVSPTLYWYRQVEGSISNRTIFTTVKHNGRELNAIEFFKDVVMEYCKENLSGPDVGAAIDRLCAAEFFNYARMVPDLIVRKEYLEQKLNLEQTRLEDRELQIKVKDEQIANRDKQISDILNSKSYKIGHKVMKPTSKVVEVLRRSKK